MEVKFLKLAQDEFDDAVTFYESEQPGLGVSFGKEVLRAITRITAYPSAYQKFGSSTRRCLIGRFPFGIVYRHDPEENEVLILAIAHLHRRPDYWVSRGL